MKLLWVNHASFIVEAGPIRLITDPWIEGTVFNSGWRLMAESKLSYEDFGDITHIWFSHEHPDHFCPSNLRCIPEQFRKRITVLFHETQDRRVVNLCQSLGFLIQELPLNHRVELSPNLSMVCGPQGILDSWMALTTSGQTLLNMNDCVFDDPGELVKIKQQAAKVDLLLTQFSFAAWIGNEHDQERHRRHAEQKLAEMHRQIKVFEPRYLVPCASYIYFSHAENFYMNRAANRIGDVYRYTREKLGCETVVLFPGEWWEIGANHDSTGSIAAYNTALDAVLAKSPDQPRKVTMEELQRAALKLIARNRRRNSRFLLSILPAVVVHLTDLGIDVEFSYRRGLRRVAGKNAVVALSADSLWYCLEFDWGGNTLEINGRYQVRPKKDPEWFFRLLRVSQHNASGERLEEVILRKVARWFGAPFRSPKASAEAE
jgi:UDP-MurNAc hydroxylase